MIYSVQSGLLAAIKISGRKVFKKELGSTSVQSYRAVNSLPKSQSISQPKQAVTLLC